MNSSSPAVPNVPYAERSDRVGTSGRPLRPLEASADQLEIGSSDWRSEVHTRIGNVSMRTEPGEEMTSSLSKHDLGDVLVGEWESPRFEGHTAATAEDPHPSTFVLLFITQGVQVINSDRRSVTLRSGSMLLSTGSEDGRFASPNGVRKFSVKAPVDALKPFMAGTRLPRHLLANIDQTPLARLLAKNLQELAVTHSQMSMLEREVARSVILNLLVGLLAGFSSDESNAQNLDRIRARVESFIVDTLENGLTPDIDSAARALFISRRTVQRAFASTNDTVRDAIRRQRLNGVRQDLLRTSLTLSALAGKWGYFDASHLTREFKDFSGQTPGEYRRGDLVVS
jgi:AraC-like DNA-binding protein